VDVQRVRDTVALATTGEPDQQCLGQALARAVAQVGQRG
jgi:hypothetical protein